MRGVEHRVPAVYLSETEVRFLAPGFAEAGDAKVRLSLNGGEPAHAGQEELVFTYTGQACVVQ